MINEKNIIVPLSRFITLDQANAKQKFIALLKLRVDIQDTSLVVQTRFRKSIGLNPMDEDEQLTQRYNNIVDQFFSSSLTTDFNLGKITKQEFIKKLLNFFSFDPEEPKQSGIESRLEDAWNNLINLNKELIAQFQVLIGLSNQDKSIYLVCDTNELHAKKIIELINQNLATNWNLPASSEKNQAIKIGNNFYLCPSYNYKSLIESPANTFPSNLFKQSTPPLISEVIKSLPDKDILLISDDEKEKNIAEKLGSKVSSAADFYSALELTFSSIATAIYDGASTYVQETNFRR